MPGALAGFAMAAFIVGVICSAFHHDVMRITEARERLCRGGVLVDVDTAGEFARHHPRVAINVPLEELEQRRAEIGPLDRPVIVFAHHWRRGLQATHALRRMGYQDVFDAAGVRTKEKLNRALVSAAEARANAKAYTELVGSPSGAGAHAG